MHVQRANTTGIQTPFTELFLKSVGRDLHRMFEGKRKSQSHNPAVRDVLFHIVNAPHRICHGIIGYQNTYTSERTPEIQTSLVGHERSRQIVHRRRPQAKFDSWIIACPKQPHVGGSRYVHRMKVSKESFVSVNTKANRRDATSFLQNVFWTFALAQHDWSSLVILLVATSSRTRPFNCSRQIDNIGIVRHFVVEVRRTVGNRVEIGDKSNHWDETWKEWRAVQRYAVSAT
ncbi:hypothetical protein BU15DRAFT_66033 [Melanogaster broomeanus]|nr:hypothetical protein BU15DRAFT_66033 [Melanogaster broomeanus]